MGQQEMSVGTYLTNLASNLVLSSGENTSITSSISTLSSRLDGWFGSRVNERFQFGSNTRGTILPRKADSKSDVDYMVVFDTSDGRKKPQTYLDRLKRFAENKYSTSDIKQSHPTLVLSLNHISFELVPAVNEYGYQIPSPAKSYMEWMSTDPTATNQALQDKNKSESYQIKPLVRLVKYWNATNSHPFVSFSLETSVVGKFFYGCSSLKDYFYQYWEGFSCSYDTAKYIKDKVDLAKKRVAKAKEYEEGGYPTLAEAEIKKVVPEL